MSKDLPIRKKTRLSGYDYHDEGLYFVTICAQERENLFGDVIDGSMVLNDVGKMIENMWEKLPAKFPHLNLDEYVVMPDHFHGIIVVNGREDPAPTLGQIIAYLKYQTTKQYNFVGAGSSRPQIKKIWQRNYYEHIIRDENDLDRIRYYIEQNPANWGKDKED